MNLTKINIKHYIQALLLLNTKLEIWIYKIGGWKMRSNF
jgi:hypothetical protein